MPSAKTIDWRACAGKLGAAVPTAKLHPAALAWARASAPDEGWVVALSGGVDSVALLLLLWAHWPDRRPQLCALHFNHGLRGAAAADDERFCRALCRALRVKYSSGRWRETRRDASEAEARSARQAFFAEQMNAMGARALWLGHQQDDVAETMLMRLARGSGAGGLAAPRPVQTMPQGRVHLRPLLTVKKRELASVLQLAGGVWREDRTNAGRRYFRNRVRHGAVEAWQAAATDRDAVAGAAWSRELLEEDDAALDAWLREIAPMARDGSLNLRRLAGKPRALVRRALHRWLLEQGRGGVLSRQAFEHLLDDAMAARATRHSVGIDAFAKIGNNRLRLSAAVRKVSA
jgi:tRNA(Ile)-lysidine synthase